jgi:diaminohydroxyphosphoribosylaminopyrimidine deaminase/5-amino-6-(5-phosphoribosylamino)uracil reductase
MVGLATVLADDPQLTTRAAVPGLHPIRLIVDSKLDIPLHSRVLDQSIAKTLVLSTNQASIQRTLQLNALGVEVIKCGDGPLVNLRQAMVLLGEREISSILLEGGGRLNGAMLEQQLIDKIIIFIAPKLIGGNNSPSNFTFPGFDNMADAIELDPVSSEVMGNNICITGYPNYSKSPD